MNPIVFYFIGYVLVSYLTFIRLNIMLENFNKKYETGHMSLGLFSGMFFLIPAAVILLFPAKITSALSILLG